MTMREIHCRVIINSPIHHLSELRPVYTERNHDERGHCDFPRHFPLESSHEGPLIQTAVIRAVTAAMCVAT